MENIIKPQGQLYDPSPACGSHKRKKPRHVWAWIYGIALTAYTAFTMLDVFVFPHDTIKVDQRAMAEVYRNADASYSTDGDSSTAKSQGSMETSGTGEENQQETISGTQESKIGQDTSEPSITTTENGYLYQDRDTTISLTKHFVYDTMVYVADIQISSVASLRSGLAEDSFGRNVKEKTSEIAERAGAILAVNGDYYGFRSSGYVIRNGILYRSQASSEDAQDLVVYQDGTMEVIREGDFTAEELLERGALQVYSFGPGLVEDGEITVTASSEVGHSMNSNPRTAIGYISPLHYVMVVSDGRTSESAGLSLLQLAEILQKLGCTEAYNLDGGGSTTMYFNGEVINNPTTNGRKESERSVSDIVYIGN